MMAQEEASLSSALDNPVLLDAVVEVISLLDIGEEAGYEDGLAGKPLRNHPLSVPEAFKVVYIRGHDKGRKRRADNKEIRKHIQRQGHCLEESSTDNVVKPEQVKAVNPVDPFKEKESFWKKYGVAIFGTVGSGIIFGAVGMYVGKIQERKRCMDVKRDMGVSDK